MTFDEAANHSIARLKLLRHAATRSRADFMLQLMVATQAAVAAGSGFVKDGHKGFERLHKRFKEIAGYE